MYSARQHLISANHAFLFVPSSMVSRDTWHSSVRCPEPHDVITHRRIVCRHVGYGLFDVLHIESRFSNHLIERHNGSPNNFYYSSGFDSSANIYYSHRDTAPSVQDATQVMMSNDWNWSEKRKHKLAKHFFLQLTKTWFNDLIRNNNYMQSRTF